MYGCAGMEITVPEQLFVVVGHDLGPVTLCSECLNVEGLVLSDLLGVTGRREGGSKCEMEG